MPSSLLQAYSRHSLSRAALLTAGAPIFLLDTYTSLILYYTAGYPPGMPFPPPPASSLRKTIQSIKQSRQITPPLKMLRGITLCVTVCALKATNKLVLRLAVMHLLNDTIVLWTWQDSPFCFCSTFVL